MNSYQGTGTGSLTFLNTPDMDHGFTTDQSTFSDRKGQPSKQPALFDHDPYGALNSNNQVSRGVIQSSPIVYARSESTQPRFEKRQQANGEAKEKGPKGNKQKPKDKRSSLFDFSRLFGRKSDHNIVSQETKSFKYIHSTPAQQHAGPQPNVGDGYSLEISRRHYGQIYDENSNPSREQVVAYIEGINQTPSYSTPYHKNKPRIPHDVMMEKKTSEKREAEQLDTSQGRVTPSRQRRLDNDYSARSASSPDRLTLEKLPEMRLETYRSISEHFDTSQENTTQSRQRHLDNQYRAHSSSSPKRPKFEDLPKRRPETYGLTGEHVFLGPLDEELLVVCHVLGHGSLGIVEEVRRKDTQFPTFVRKHVALSARMAQA
jgi:hypothetical protein